LNGEDMYTYYNTSYAYQRHQYPAYRSYPTANSSNSSACLTQVLTSYAPGATVLCLDPKEKASLPVNPRVRIVGLAAFLCLALLGATACLSMDGVIPSGRVEAANFTVSRQNSSGIHGAAETGVETQLESPSAKKPLKRVIYLFDFDDSDPYNEARVETLRW